MWKVPRMTVPVLLTFLASTCNAWLLPTIPIRPASVCAHITRSVRHLSALHMTIEKRRIAVSSGRGNSGTELGSHITDGLRIKDQVVTCIEPQLRKVANSAIECSLDDVYQKEHLDHTDAEFMAWHAASGMRVMSGCPVHVLYGIKGGCDACKCRMPSMDEVKRFCPYYGSAGKDQAQRSAWDLKESILDVLRETSTLVMISAGEDISDGPETPSHQIILQGQKELIDIAKKASVNEIVLVGPSDEPPLSAGKQTERARLDFEIVHGLYPVHTQFEGFTEPIESQNEKSTNAVLGRNIPPLLAESYLKQNGIAHRVIRAPYEFLKGPDFANVVVESILHPKTSETHTFVRPKKAQKKEKFVPKSYQNAASAAVGGGDGTAPVSKSSILHEGGSFTE